jgi:long-chain acyl-CoA synthetase
VLLKPREIAYHLRDAEVKAYFCQVGTFELPMGEMSFSAFQETDNCKYFFLMTNDQFATAPTKGVQSLIELMRNQSVTFETVFMNSDDTAVIRYTVVQRASLREQSLVIVIDDERPSLG